MSWMLDLYETYEKNSSKVGNVEISATNQEYTLVPISHTYQAAQVEITITLTGEILSADVIQKEKSSTLIPCTIDSATRSNAPVPHPLHDKLMYVAGDYEAYGGKIKKDNPHQAYLEQLERWCAFDNDNEQIQAVYQYVKKGCLIADLVARGVLYTENGKLLLKWSGSTNKPAIFQALAGDQTTTFVRFKVVDTTKIFEPMWEDKAMFDSYIAFYKTQLTTTGLCYVTGKTTALVEKHPSKLRYAGDMAKLISANDTNGYTYRGLFSDKNQVATISYEASQKAHNALKWLITRQGKVIDGRVFLFWSKENLDVVSVDEDLASQFGLDLHTREDEETADTAIEFARAFKYAAPGVSSKFNGRQSGDFIST
ncbi:type I-C CRISPR-associated protein Cas8c/Csd1 [Brochothrix thermosphacta]|uniref:type I-C CRISPR-associated protein Cas8c/Csd1 n=1 Tax=Brochothrix thermosphacta TaxID=2756 RepID=UPI00265CB682|nr:type I-C CRISPR-associated protein Cas8c/Csd1 [Brochothrix thermosphacta]WKK70079.1 type I-C CRISPR-associated protein Cas8c/Csd1 [Brochothrix thermosphacta]